MDIWLAAALLAWVPTAAVLALLVGRTVAHSEARDRLATRHLRAGDPVPVVVQRSAHLRRSARQAGERAHHLAS